MRSIKNPKPSKKKQITKYLFHNRAFNITNNKYLHLFEDLLRNSEESILECSIKFHGDHIYPYRYNMWYKGKDHIKNINSAFHFLERLSNTGACINYDLLKEICNKDMDLKRIKDVIVGLDLRDNIKESRAKFWLIIDRQYADVFNKVLNVHGYDQKVNSLVNENDLLFGFDFRFDGNSRIKIYPHYNKNQLQSKKMMNKLHTLFSPAICRLASMCNHVYVSFENKTFDRILHFHPNKIDDFFSLINDDRLQKYKSHVKETSGYCVISLKEKEIDEGTIKEINLYY